MERVSGQLSPTSGFSNTIRVATGGRLVLDSFRLPAGAHVRPVQPGEVRVVKRSGDRDIAWLVNLRAKTAAKVSIVGAGAGVALDVKVILSPPCIFH